MIIDCYINIGGSNGPYFIHMDLSLEEEKFLYYITNGYVPEEKPEFYGSIDIGCVNSSYQIFFKTEDQYNKAISQLNEISKPYV